MALNTYPYSPFPASTEQLHKGDNEDLQAQINAIKDGTDIDSFGDVENALSVVTGDITNIETDKADLEVVAAEFNAEAGTYDVGDLVTYDGKLYEFTSAHSTAGAWDPTEVTEKTIADEIDTLKSGLTNYENQNNINLEVPDRKNVLPMTVESIKSENTNGTWSSNAYTINGVTFTVLTDNDGNVSGIKVIGATSGGNAVFTLSITPPLKGNTQYTLNGCPAGGSDSTYNMQYSNMQTYAYTDSGSGIAIQKFDYSIYPESAVTIRIINGYSVPTGGLTFYPMVRLATETDPTFVPYIPSVESRIEDVESGLDTVKSGLTNLVNYSLVVVMGAGADGQNYYIDLSNYTFTGGRTPVIILCGNQNTGAKIELGFQNQGSFAFNPDSGITWDSETKRINIDSGSYAWTNPYLLFPKALLSNS